MENNNRYKIYPELNFGVAKLESGMKSINEIYELAKVFREDKNFSKVNYQLSDLRGCIFNFEIKEIAKMKLLVETYNNIDNQKLVVYMIDMPTETAYVHMFFDLLNREREYCSTTEKAYKLFNLLVSYEEFLKLINI